jgi:cysteine desulfurase/selenocysteine lyase
LDNKMLPSDIKKDFPWFASAAGRGTVYLDSAATTHKPLKVLETLNLLYAEYTAPVSRSIHHSGELLTELYSRARSSMAAFLGVSRPDEIVFTKNCTEAINTVSGGMLFSEDPLFSLKPGDRIITTVMEHHSNLVPWQQLGRITGAEVLCADIGPDGKISTEHFRSLINERVRIAAFSHASNVLGTVNPVEELTALCRESGIISIIDGTQAVPHMPLNIPDIGCDFYALSGHKMLAPAGTGVLWGRRELLVKLHPSSFGGGMVDRVSLQGASWAGAPQKFEAGTTDVWGAISLAGADDPSSGKHLYGALDYLAELGMENIEDHEKNLRTAALGGMRVIKEIEIIGPGAEDSENGIISFIIKKDGEIADCHTAGVMLSHEGIALRAGGHCAYPLMNRLGLEGTLRASFYVYNDMDDIEKFIRALKQIVQYL